MCNRLIDLLGKADDGLLDEAALRELGVHLDGCAPIAVRLVRERCPRAAAPSSLRVRVLQIFRAQACHTETTFD
ncbi:MAG TPA: hypothetical protein VMT85_13625 [Thermoanaerobaculia bacterium]|nr:hypothetical protein [Thermoanaerobaculia bacterium]